ncbi:hypothetical protein [Proteiniphilum sp. UBA1028]|uniref:exo-rhamnogalacturonan lyase family protein n=1 Tax=Proteiniphilum sp. UBA1028 TaxID=1947251 RepID=UPI0025DDE1D2|nr:hypothetical protein [Proteiniphilum sp. UBA1028]
MKHVEEGRSLLWLMTLSIFFSFIAPQQAGSQPLQYQLNWLGGVTPSIATGVSFGVPFPKGTFQKNQQFILKNQDEKTLPLQSWSMAYWPDGSLKWAGFSTVVDNCSEKGFFLEPTQMLSENPSQATVSLEESDDLIRVNTGALICLIPTKGEKLIRSITVGDREVSTGGELVCLLQDGLAEEHGPQPEILKFVGSVDKVTVEQSGPVRAVIKVEGSHKSVPGKRRWLPYVVRIYFYGGMQTIKMVHTIIYDGNQEKDFIRGLGVRFDVPLNDELYNRHVRFAGEKGRLWDEPIQPITGRVPLSRNENLYEKQLRGEAIPPRNHFDSLQQHLLKHWASWGDYKLNQLNADGFTVEKRTTAASAWIEAGAGKRAEGLAFVGDASGGLAISLRNFWQSYPSSLEIRNACSKSAQMTAWMWSPDAQPMDMRHYDTIPWGHDLLASYEDVQPGFSIATGVARTSELLLYGTGQIPDHKIFEGLTDLASEPPLLVATPDYLHQVSAFGIWSLPDRSSTGKRWIEDQLDKAFEYYQKEVDQRRWYGFWNFGDVMHAYDQERHVWRYDIGGYAWDNTELMPNLWLWYSFLRSGRADIFRMAEAMTRHTGEVDVYHLGRFAGLGSRHNVRHWGCGSKEVRIAQALLGRFYYYLTTDERTGDLMRFVANASNNAIGEIDPLRLILEKSDYPTHARMGPDWLALAGNWMIEWERTGDPEWRERIKKGVKSFSKMPYGLFSGRGAAMGYNPETYQLYQLTQEDIGYSHLSVLMGGPEMAYELTDLLDDADWTRLWMQFTRLYGASKEEIFREFGVSVKLGDPGHWYARLPAYYAHKTGQRKWARRAWYDFLNTHTHFEPKLFDNIETLEPVYEVEGVSTNNTAQWGLNAIQLLEMIGDQLPEEHERFQTKQE